MMISPAVAIFDEIPILNDIIKTERVKVFPRDGEFLDFFTFIFKL